MQSLQRIPSEWSERRAKPSKRKELQMQANKNKWHPVSMIECSFDRGEKKKGRRRRSEIEENAVHKLIKTSDERRNDFPHASLVTLSRSHEQKELCRCEREN